MNCCYHLGPFFIYFKLKGVPQYLLLEVMLFVANYQMPNAERIITIASFEAITNAQNSNDNLKLSVVSHNDASSVKILPLCFC